MMDDDADVLRQIGDPDRALYYDFFKWITTLSLVAIGGVFSLITQSDFVFRPADLIVVLAALSISALTGLSGVTQQITLAHDPLKLAKRNKLLQNIVQFFLGIGAGYFVLLFSEKLFA
jgi:hypothetical protein